MPSKTFSKVKTHAKLEQRKAHLDQFLKECVRREDIMTSEESILFFELSKNPKKLIQEPPVCSDILGDLSFPIIDFEFYEQFNLLILGTSDLGGGSRFYSHILNINMPWSDKNNYRISAPISELYIYNLQTQEENPIEMFTKNVANNLIFKATFKETLNCFELNQESSILSVSVGDGCIILFLLKINQSPQQQIYDQPMVNLDSQINYDIILSIKPHDKAVTGIFVDIEAGFIYTCSRDKFFQVLDLEKRNSISLLQVDEDPLVVMQMDFPKRWSYVGSESGVLCIIDISNKHPSIITRFSVANEIGINQIQLDTVQNYIFISQKSQISSVYQVNTEKNPIKLIDYIGRVNSTAICWNRNKKDVFIGDIHGNINVWGLSDIPKYVWKAHNQQIQKIQYIESFKIVISASRDKTLKLWKLPNTWIPKEWDRFLQNQEQVKQHIGGKLVQSSVIKQFQEQEDSKNQNQTKEEEKQPWVKK